MTNLLAFCCCCI
jgi:hypothetical protein